MGNGHIVTLCYVPLQTPLEHPYPLRILKLAASCNTSCTATEGWWSRWTRTALRGYLVLCQPDSAGQGAALVSCAGARQRWPEHLCCAKQSGAGRLLASRSPIRAWVLILRISGTERISYVRPAPVAVAFSADLLPHSQLGLHDFRFHAFQYQLTKQGAGRCAFDAYAGTSWPIRRGLAFTITLRWRGCGPCTCLHPCAPDPRTELPQPFRPATHCAAASAYRGFRAAPGCVLP